MTPEAPGPRDGPLPWLLVPGLAIGFLGSLCGIGGGLFAVPLLHFVRKLELKVAVATALGLVLATTSAATLLEALRRDTVLSASLVACLAGGALVGAQLGFHVSERIPTRRLRQVFVLVLAYAGWRVLRGGSGETGEALRELTALDHVRAVLVGLGGGFVAPLLGVGGGLVMVPGLYLGAGGLPFVVARASSLAAGSVTALRSLWLHGRAGRVRGREALVLGVGAAVGAALGVQVTHHPGFAAAGRMLLGSILCLVALRFAFELWREPRARPRPGESPESR